MKVEIYDLGFDCYRVVQKSLFKDVNVFDVTDVDNLRDIIKDISMNTRNNCQKQPKFVFYF